MKQSTFSAEMANSIQNLWQRYSQSLRLLLVMLLTLTASTAWGADVVYKTAKFGSSYNSGKISSYTSSWYSTYDDFRVDIVNANNNNNGWSYIKMGSKNAASTGSITTNAKIDAAITKVSLKIDAITANNITSITLKTATSSNGTYTSVGTFSKTTGTQTVTLTSPTANLFYKIEVVCTKGSSNGLIQISQVDYYKADAVSCTTNPTVSAGSYSSVTSTTATVSCSGGITSLGSAGCSITSYGFVYGTTADPTISNTKVQVGTTYTTTGTSFSKGLTGLTANTTYYVRPYATNGNGTAYGTQTSFKTLELPKYTVTLVPGSGSVPSTTLTETSAGAGVTLTTPTLDCGDWEFAGWAKASVGTEITEEPTLIPAGAYPLTSDITLYAVYQRTEETEGNGGGTEVTKSVSIFDYATAHSWSNATKYESVTIDENITATASSNGSNTGKYYNSGTNWRFYQNESPKLTISAATGCTITKVKVTYSVDNTGVLTYGGTNVNSGTATNINATSATFGVGNTGSATNGQVRITAIEVTYTTSGGGSTTTTYYHSTPECGTPCIDAVNVMKGTPSNGSFTMVSGYQSTCNGTVKVTLSDIEPAAGYQFSEITQSGVDAAKVTIDNTAKTVTYAQNTSGTSTINVTFIKIPTYTVTWMVNGEKLISGVGGDTFTTNITGGNSILDLPDEPAAPAGCSDKVFVGWTTKPIDSEVDTPPSELFDVLGDFPAVTKNATYYAVWADEIPGSGGDDVNDVLNREWTGVSGTSYTDWSGKKLASSAVYAGNSAVGNSSIQLRSDKNNSGIITTTSGGKIKKVVVSWNGSTSSNRALQIYGKNTPYELSSDLYDDETKGELLGEIHYGVNNSTDVTGDYSYIGLRSASGAMYLDWIQITWATGTPTTYTAYTTLCDNTKAMVTYDLNGGTGAICESQKVMKGVEFALCNQTPTKTGYNFTGWLSIISSPLNLCLTSTV